MTRSSESPPLASPLSGKRILVTRPRDQAARLCALLAAQGAEPIIFPTIEIAPLDSYAALDAAINQLQRYHWLIFTSANGVTAFWARLSLRGAALPPQVRLAAVGPATALALAAHGAASLVPEQHQAEAIAAILGDVAGQWVLLPAADIAREALADALRLRAAVVHQVPAYRTLPAAPDPAARAALAAGLDAVTLTSASTARNFAALLGGELQSIAGRAVIACLGPLTAQAARRAGLPVHVTAADTTLESLVSALAAYFARAADAASED